MRARSKNSSVVLVYAWKSRKNNILVQNAAVLFPFKTGNAASVKKELSCQHGGPKNVSRRFKTRQDFDDRSGRFDPGVFFA